MTEEKAEELDIPTLGHMRFFFLLRSLLYPIVLVPAGVWIGKYPGGGDIATLLFFAIAFGVFVYNQYRLYKLRPGSENAHYYQQWRKKCLAAGEIVPINS